MKHLKIFICASLLVCSFSCYGQDIFSFNEEKEGVIPLTYANLSNLLQLEKIEKVIETLQVEPTLASLLTLKEVEAIGWKNWVIINKNIFTLQPKDIISVTQSSTAIPLEIDAWIESLDKNIIIKLLEDKLEIALLGELERDWYDWNEAKDELSQQEKKIFKDRIESKIIHLTNQKNKETIINLFKNAKLKISIIQE